MIVSRNRLYRKMLVTPRLNLDCDGIKIRCAYVKNEEGSGWVVENFDNDNQVVWHKGRTTDQVVDLIVEKYKEINITWTKSF